MKTDRVNYQPNFKASVSYRFINSAEKMLKQDRRYDILSNFRKKVDDFENYGFDDYKIFFKKVKDGDKVNFGLFAGNGENEVLLSQKNKFRKIVEKFTHITKYEFTKKME